MTDRRDFTITPNNVHPSVVGGSRKEAHLSIPFPNLTQDTWFVVVVKGSDGVSRPMFPVHPANLAAAGNTTLANLTDGNLGQQGVTALGVHQRALRRRRRESGIRRASGTVKLAATAAVVLGMAAVVAVATPADGAPPAAATAPAVLAPTPGAHRHTPAPSPATDRQRPAAVGGVAILASAARAQAVVAGVVSEPASIDVHGWRAVLRVDHVLSGSLRLGDTVTIAWEELSAARQVRFADGERVLVVLDPLPTQSLWRKRFPTADRAHPVLVVASSGDAFLARPDGGTLDALGHYLAMTPDARNGKPGVQRLAELVRGGHPAVAREALALLEGDPARADLLGADGAASLARRRPQLRARARAARWRVGPRRAPPSPGYARDRARARSSPARRFAPTPIVPWPRFPTAFRPSGWRACCRTRIPICASSVSRWRATTSPASDWWRSRVGIRRRRCASPPGARCSPATATTGSPTSSALLDDPDAAVRSGIAESIGVLGEAAVAPLRAVVDGRASAPRSPLCSDSRAPAGKAASGGVDRREPSATRRCARSRSSRSARRRGTRTDSFRARPFAG